MTKARERKPGQSRPGERNPRRRRDAYWLGGLVVLTILGLVVGANHYNRTKEAKRAEQAANQPPTPPSILVRPHSHSLGPEDARVTVVEFLDPECESCREMYPAVKQLLKEYAGRMRLVVRIMPFHHNSLQAGTALEAAAEQGRYWELLEILFENQPRWGSHHDPKPELIPVFAREIGLDMNAFNRSLDNPVHRQRLEMDKADGRALGITGTPTFIVNGRLVERLGYEPLKMAIEEALKK